MRRFTCLLIAICWLPPSAAVADEVGKLVERLGDYQPKERYEAALSLKKLGAKAEPAIEPLATRLDDRGVPLDWVFGNDPGPRVCDAAADALAAIGQPAVPALIHALHHDKPAVRQLAAETLARIGPLAKEAAGPLIELAQSSDDWKVRAGAIRTVAIIATDPDTVLPILKQTFHNEQEELWVRLAALEASHDADPDATSVLPMLMEALQNDDGNIIACAAQTLGKFGDKAKPAVPELIAVLPSEKLRWGGIGNLTFQVPIRNDIVQALANIGHTAESAVPSLRAIMDEDANDVTRLWAAGALARIVTPSDDGKRAFFLLLGRIQDEKDPRRAEAAKVMASLGSKSAAIVLSDALKAAGQSTDPRFQEVFVEALGGMGPIAAPAVPALRDALRPDDADPYGLPLSAAKALGQIGPEAKTALPELKRLRERFRNYGDVVNRQYVDEAIERILTGADEE